MSENEIDELPERYLKCLPTEEMRQQAKIAYRIIREAKRGCLFTFSRQRHQKNNPR